MPIQNSKLFDKVCGCLTGAAVGDALGQPCRGMDWRKVEATFGKITEFHPWPVSGKGAPAHSAGEVGDLARFAIAFADRAGRTGGRPRTPLLIDELFAQDNLESLPAQAALARIRAGIEPSRSAVPELAGPEALYLAIPIGIASIGDPETAFMAARTIVGPILLGPSLEIGQVFAAIIAAALMPNATPASVLAAGLDIAPPSAAKLLQPAAHFAKEHLGHPVHLVMPAMYERFSSKSTSDPHSPVIEALAIAMIFAYVYDGLPEQATSAAVAYGNLSHAIGAAAGAVCGAISGLHRIPAHWQTQINSANPSVDISTTASGLVRIITDEGHRQKQRLEALESMAQEN